MKALPKIVFHGYGEGLCIKSDESILLLLEHIRWELGQEIVRYIGPNDEAKQREAIGRFHLGHAIALCSAGEVQPAPAALDVVADYSLVSPPCRRPRPEATRRSPSGN
jgi:hypothetical protein